MEKKIVITVREDDFGIETDFDPFELVFWLEYAKLEILNNRVVIDDSAE